MLTVNRMGTFVSIGDRLKEERLRFGWSQTDAAELCGVTRRSVVNYESGDRVPDADYLAKLAEAGADVMYVLTGRRTPAVAYATARANAIAHGAVWEPANSSREDLMVERFRTLDEEGKAALEKMADALFFAAHRAGR